MAMEEGDGERVRGVEYARFEEREITNSIRAKSMCRERVVALEFSACTHIKCVLERLFVRAAFDPCRVNCARSKCAGE